MDGPKFMEASQFMNTKSNKMQSSAAAFGVRKWSSDSDSFRITEAE